MFPRAVSISLLLLAALQGCNSSADHATTAAVPVAGHAPDAPAAATPAPASEAPAPDTSANPEPPASTSVSSAHVEAQGGPPQDFTLTMDRVDAYMAAISNIAVLAQQDPELKDITAMDASTEDARQYAARIEQHPDVVAAISQAGLTPKEFAVTGEALVSGMMTQAALESGALKDIPAGVNPQLVEFVRQNKAALNAKWKTLQAPH